MFFAFDLNGQTHVVDAPNKPAANAYASSLMQVELRAATKADLTGLNLGDIPSVVKGGKTPEQLEQDAVEAAERKAKREAKKAAA